MEEQILQIIANNLTEREDLAALVEKLKFVKNSLISSQTGPITAKLSGKLDKQMELIFLTLESRNLIPTVEADQIAYITEIIKVLEKIPVVRITLAFSPTREFVRKLQETISSYLGRKVLLDIVFDHTIVAGCVLDFEGKYRDYSEQKDLEEVLRKKLKNLQVKEEQTVS